MARQPSPFYSPDPTAEIGSNLVRAIFGDPAARQAQAEAQAQMDQRQAAAEASRAAAGYDIARTGGVTRQNTASDGLPALFAGLQPAPRPAPPETLDGFLSPDYQPAGPQESPDDAMRRGLPSLIAGMAQLQGDKVDTSETIGTLASFLGGDEMARRGLVAQGQTPGKQFALTPDRADDIARQATDADYRKGTAVALINNRDDVPVANIQAGASRYGADRRLDGTRYTADKGAESRSEVAYIRGQGTTVPDGRAVVSAIYPGARITQVERDPNSALGRKNPGSLHNSTHGAIDVAPMPGMSFEQYVQGYRDKGYSILEAKNEVGAGRSAHATGDHWHVVLGQPAGGKTAKASEKAAGPIATNAEGHKVQWNGQAWVAIN